MAVESCRGCGYRKAGGLYLVGDLSEAVPVGWLPTCITQAQSRSAQWADPKELLAACPPDGAAAYRARERALLMFVGEKHYSPTSFMAEAMRLGVSKRVAGIPEDAKPGDPVALAHPAAMYVSTAEELPAVLHHDCCRVIRCEHVPAAIALANMMRGVGRNLVGRKPGAKVRELGAHDPAHVAGVFCLFQLRAVELVLPASVAADAEIRRRCAARGVSIVAVPDSDPDHVVPGWKLPAWLRDDEPMLPGITEAAPGPGLDSETE